MLRFNRFFNTLVDSLQYLTWMGKLFLLPYKLRKAAKTLNT